MGFSSKRAGALLVMATCATAAGADPMTFDFSGFGTAGATYADTNKAEFARDMQSTGADSNVAFDVDSLVGIQGTVHFSSNLSATAQVVLRRVVTRDYSLDVPVAFVKDQLTPDLAIRLGRLPLPLFMVSDYREVGFANIFLRPPQEVYGGAPVYTLNGADLLYTHSLGPIEVNGQLGYGGYEFDGANFNSTSKRVLSGNLSATYGPLTLRYGRTIQKNTITSGADQVIDGVRAAGFTELADALDNHNRPTSFTAFGAILDWHNFVLQGESTVADTNGSNGRVRGQYALAGVRVQKFTPYVMYSQRKVLSETSDNTIPAVGPLLPLAEAVDAILVKYNQHTISAGVRWDFRDSMDLKLQIDHVSPQGPGMFINVQPGFSGPVTVGGLAVDFVF